MTNQLELMLPYPPSINRLYRAGRKGYWMTKVGADFKQKVLEVVINAKSPTFDTSNWLVVTILMFPDTNRRRDVDSGIKIILDSLQLANVFENDYQVRKLIVERMPKLTKGVVAHCIVRIQIDSSRETL